ncbi:uncharacterized protein LOC143360367 isoform X2 [Halictus rubicundus]
MTRYARAKGSKASNEKTPDEATPWHILKQQLNGNLSKQGHIEKPKSAKELLQDKEVLYCDVGNIKNDWAEFEESILTKNRNPIRKKNKKRKDTLVDITVTSDENKKNGDNVNSQKKSQKKRNIDETDTSMIDVKMKKPKKDKNLLLQINNNLKEKSSISQDNAEKNEVTKKHTKLNKKNKQNKQNDDKSSETSMNSNNVSQTIIGVITEENISNNKSNLCVTEVKKDLSSKHNIRQQKKHNVDYKSSNNHMINRNNGRNKNNENSNAIQKFNKTNTSKSNHSKFHGPNFENNKNNNKKPRKVRDDKEHKRRKPEVDSTKLTINGMEIEVVKFDGFPIKKEDADRLCELKQKMIMKGIPEKEIDRAMKLERRRAEKALARIRKCVCFHCRKAGHNLSDCPELGSEQACTGICFKCGSTEHTHFECKVAKPTEFRFATCFICREQGHIAKQCPDNPRGTYPQGGSCKLCGDVTHLKKDCPNLMKEKEENTITVNTIADGNIESLEGSKHSVQIAENKKPKKVVKF